MSHPPCSAESADDTKLVYVKRWRTLVKLPAKYADEIVQALRVPNDAQAARDDATCYLNRSQVRLILMEHNAATQAVLPKIDALKIFVASDFTAQPQTAWLPIETAPKDGTRVDLLFPGNMRFTDCGWSEGQWWTTEDDEPSACLSHGPSQPTHWMRIPALPRPQSGGGK